jgi:monoamine oxidase
MANYPDAVIIGAGAAGLSAAKALTERRLSFKMVEGSHRIGGRAYAEEIAPGVWFDLGCSFLHQGATNPFGPIADALGIVLNHDRADALTSIRGVHEGQPLSNESASGFIGYLHACDAAITVSAARGEDRAIIDLVDTENPFFLTYANMMATINSVDIDETSAADYAGFAEVEGDRKLDIPVPGGFGNLVKAWGADVDVILNCAVEKVDWSGSGVTVETVKGTIHARTALVTVSTGILAANKIQFDPVLPDWKTDAYFGLPTGTLNKICLHFDKNVFGRNGLGLIATWSEDGNHALIEASVNDNNTAIVYIGGRQGVWLEKQGQQASYDFALDRVADVFGNDVRKHVTRFIATAWATEPWTLGSYSCALPGQAYQRIELGKPIDDRLFFAGEATISGANSTCHGAYLSGIRAAEEIAAITR